MDVLHARAIAKKDNPILVFRIQIQIRSFGNSAKGPFLFYTVQSLIIIKSLLMKTQINVLGYTGNNSQFVVKTLNANLRMDQNEKYPELEGPNPYEYILAGFAGCINALGQEVATEQGIALRSLQIEITGSLEKEGRKVRPGFRNIEITLKPSSSAPLDVLQTWMKEVQHRSPVYDTLVSNTPVHLNLYKEYTYN
jgi:uncharacterized OsmC-like protein